MTLKPIMPWMKRLRKTDKKLRYLSFVLLMCLTGCVPKDYIPENVSSGEEGSIDKSLVVREDAVIFMTLTQVELDSYESGKYDQLSEVLADFYADANRAIIILREHGFDPIYSDAKKITFQYSNGKKETLPIETSEHIIAMVLFGRGKKPEIGYGILSQDVMLRKVADYFGIALK
jgi:hypothetical protein